MKTILFGTDFSTAADAALVQAINLARREDAELVIAHVRPDRSVIAEAVRELYGEGDGAEADSLASELRARCIRAREQGVGAHHTVLDGDPARALAEHARAIGADTLVVGSFGKTGVERFLLGSTAEQAIRRAPCPVLVARADTGATHGYRSVLVATDFSGAADLALARAADLVASDGRIELFHVMTPPSGVGVGFGAGPVDPEIEDRLRASVTDALERRAAQHSSCRARLEHSAMFGPIARTIVDKLDERAFDLVALGSHARTGLERAFIGSVAEKVVRHAPCSALVFPDPDNGADR